MKLSNQVNICSNKNGSMLVMVIVFVTLFMTIAMGAISLGILEQKLNRKKVASAQAIHVAEAGINYYRWVLYHNHEEYCNKEACLPSPDYGPYGPYSYTDSSGQGIQGYYELYITPPAINGSTIVNIKSIGWVASEPNVKREVEVQCGIPSWTTYATLVNSALNYGASSEVWGPIHSNTGIRFDGIAAHNLVSSSKTFYNDNNNYFGVYTTGDPNPSGNPPTNLPNPDWAKFMAGRSFGPTNSPVVSFDLLDVHIGQNYAKATSSGLIFDPDSSTDPYAQAWGRNCSFSGGDCDEGYHITLKPNNKFDISKVSSVYANCDGDPSKSILTETDTTEFDIPSNGIIFVKNTTWVDGLIDNSRVTVMAFKDPITNNSGTGDIYITSDVLYTNYDGSDSIGLIAQRDVSMGLRCENDLRIDAALLAKNGRRFRESYSSCSGWGSRNSLTIYGNTASYLSPYSSSFSSRQYIYDSNLTFTPPPHYPTTGEYTFISWKEK